MFQSGIGVLPVVSCGCAPGHVHQKTSFKKTPHVSGSVNLLDFHFRIDVAMIEEVDVDFLHFRYAIFVRNHGNDIVQRQQTVALDFRVDIFAHCAQGQQTDQFNVVLEGSSVPVQEAVAFRPHHFHQGIERGLVVVKDQDVLSDVDQFLHHHILALPDKLSFRPDDRLQEMDVFDVTAVSFDAVDEMLDDFIAEFSAQLRIVLEDGAHGLRF